MPGISLLGRLLAELLLTKNKCVSWNIVGFSYLGHSRNFHQPCSLCLLLMLFIIQGRRLGTNFYTSRAGVILNQFVQQLHKLTGLSSRLTSTKLDALWMRRTTLDETSTSYGLMFIWNSCAIQRKT